MLAELESPALVVGGHQASNGRDDPKETNKAAGQVHKVKSRQRNPEISRVLHHVYHQGLVVCYDIGDQLPCRGR